MSDRAEPAPEASAAPIVDEGELCGLVSIGDVVKAQLNESEAEIRHLRSYITGLPT